MPRDDNERHWVQLLELLEERQVIPVIGPELLTVPGPNGDERLYRRVAEQLLQENGLRAAPGDVPGANGEVVLRRNLELNDAVSELSRAGARPQDLYSPIKALIQSAVEQCATLPRPLQLLAGIPAFDLFVSTTSDNLMRRALAERGTVDEVVFAPNLPGNQVHDIPEHRHSAYRAVFYMFGRAAASPVYAIHEEDRLEFFYMLVTEQKNVPAVMLSELRARNLLFVGCALSEWLARFFIRFASRSRLSDSLRKREFLIEGPVDDGRSLAVFLERFSQNTHIFPGSPAAFVGELAQRWQARHPDKPMQPAAAGPASGPARSLEPDIFISYAHGDLPAAKALYEELAGLGFGVEWFDKSELKPGDLWNAEIQGAIRTCAFFVPLLSATTEQRDEGYFLREWNAAADRTKEMVTRRFIFPVVIDETFDGDPGRYRQKPPEFAKAQFGHAPGGHMTDQLRDALVLALRERRRPPNR